MNQVFRPEIVLLAALTLGLVSGCGGSHLPAEAMQPEPSAAAREPIEGPPVEPQESEPAEPEVPAISVTELEPLFADSPDFNLEIQFPTSAQRITKARAAAYKVRLQLSGQKIHPGAKVRLQLDDHQPRLVSPSELVSLSSLVDEDRELLPGAHTLMAVALNEHQVPYLAREDWARGPAAWVRFHVLGDGVTGEDTPGAAQPLIGIINPHGTYNGAERGAQVRLDFFTAPALGRGSAHAVRLIIQGDSKQRFERVLRSTQPLQISGLESGDFLFELTLLDKAGQPLVTPGSQVKQVITLNLDVEPPEPAKN